MTFKKLVIYSGTLRGTVVKKLKLPNALLVNIILTEYFTLFGCFTLLRSRGEGWLNSI